MEVLERMPFEQMKAIEIARMLKKSGIDIAVIANSTGLTAEEIEKL